MNELGGKLVNVVLAVEDGKGMEYIKNPITLIANFNGRILESDPANPEECPIFNTELVWEIEKKDLRKIRSSNVPLRVECFTTDINSRKLKVGFILLSLRSAHIVSKKCANQEVPFKWQRLNGVSHDIRNRHPELYLSLSIRECVPDEVCSKKEEQSPFLAEEVLELTDDFVNIVPLKYLEDGFIQVGDGDDLEPFCLSMTVKVAANLDVLLPETLVFNETKDKYHLSFTLFGITIKSKNLKGLHENIDLNEKIVVSLLSRFETLQEFFSKYHKISVCFHNGPDKLGITKINVERLLQDETNSCEEICYFHLSGDESQIPVSVNGRKPFIEVKISLEQREDADEMPSPGAGEAKRIKTITSSLEKIAVDATGDAKASPKASPLPSTDSVIKSYVSPRQIYVPMLELDEEEEIPPAYRNFCLRLILENISWKKQPNIKQFQIQFWHPRADTSLCFNMETQNDLEQIIEGVECRIYFISTKKQVKGLLYAWRPRIMLLNARGNPFSDVIRLESEVFALNDTQEHTQIFTMKNVEDNQILAEVTVVMHVEHVDQLFEAKQGDLYPPILDERILVLQLNELKDFKEKLIQLYENDLEVREKQKLDALEDEWRKNKEDLERKLNKNVRKCKLLTKELKAAAQNLRTRQKTVVEVHTSETSLHEEINVNYSKFANHQYVQLIEEISKLRLENKQLREIVENHREELEANKQSALTKEQTTNLLKELRVLEEQFEEAQKQKSYFKEQWKKAVNEIHSLRTEEQKQLLCEIEQNKQELSQLSLDCASSCGEEGSEVSPRQE